MVSISTARVLPTQHEKIFPNNKELFIFFSVYCFIIIKSINLNLYA